MNTRSEAGAPQLSERASAGRRGPVPLAEVLRSFRPTSARLGSARRLWPTLVGPGLAQDSRVLALRGAALVVAATGDSVIDRLRPLEGFLLRTLSDRVDGPRLRRVEYRLASTMGTDSGRRAGGADPRGRAPRALTEPEQRAISEAVSRIGDAALAAKAQAWMVAALTREERET